MFEFTAFFPMIHRSLSLYYVIKLGALLSNLSLSDLYDSNKIYTVRYITCSLSSRSVFFLQEKREMRSLSVHQRVIRSALFILGKSRLFKSFEYESSERTRDGVEIPTE